MTDPSARIDLGGNFALAAEKCCNGGLCTCAAGCGCACLSCVC